MSLSPHPELRSWWRDELFRVKKNVKCLWSPCGVSFIWWESRNWKPHKLYECLYMYSRWNCAPDSYRHMQNMQIVYISNQIKSNHFYCRITTAQVSWWVKFLRACSSAKQKTKKTTIYIWTVRIYRLYRRQCAKNKYIYSVHTVYYKDIVIDTHYTPYVHIYIMYTSIHSIMWRCNRLYIYSRLVVQQIVVQRCNRLCICNVVDVLCMLSSDSRCVSAVCACSPSCACSP